jgi:carbonic anhydrase
MHALQHGVQLPPQLRSRSEARHARDRRATHAGRPRHAAELRQAVRADAAPQRTLEPRRVLLSRRKLFDIAACTCCAQLSLPRIAQANEWEYAGAAAGVAAWSAVSKTCAVGGAQSPIDIVTAAAQAAAPDTCDCAASCAGASVQQPNEAPDDAPRRSALHFDYAPQPVTVVNTGHGTMQARLRCCVPRRARPLSSTCLWPAQVNFAAGSAPRLSADGRTLELLQFHFHSPSEHALDGNRRARGTRQVEGC